MGPSSSHGRIAVDAMGGDLGPSEVVEAVKLSVRGQLGIGGITLVGDEAILAPLLKKVGLGADDDVLIFHAPDVITMEDKPLTALKKKKDSSMLRAIELVKNGDARGVVSCGNTGALMAGGTLRLRTIEGVERPALATVMPHKVGHFILLDAGANPEARADHMVHNAVLGSNYARIVLGIEKPRVGLLTIGTEEGKGNALIADTHEHLKKLGGLIEYSGPIEGFQLFENHVDVVVCDGFVGNILLKSCESLFKMLKGFVSEEMRKNPLRMVGAALSSGAFSAVKAQLNPDRYGGAPLLGLKGNVFKAHGSSNRHAICSAIRIATEVVKKDMNHRIEAEIGQANAIMRPADAL